MADAPKRRPGRPAKSPAGPKRANLKLRIHQNTRAALEQRAAQNGRSLSEEAEALIEQAMQSLDVFMQGLDFAVGEDSAALALLIGRIANSVGANAKQRSSWLTDPYAFDQVVQGITAALEALRPSGEIIEPLPPTGRFAAGLSLLATEEGRKKLGRLLAHGELVGLVKPGEGSRSPWAERITSRFEPEVLDQLRSKLYREDDENG